MSTTWDSLVNSELIDYTSDTTDTSAQQNPLDNTRIDCECGVKYRKGQEEKHCKSKKHLSNTRKKVKLRATKHVDFQCKACDIQFTNDEFYQNHLGSKTHKRNAPKLESDKGDEIVPEVINPFSRKKYKPRQEADVLNIQEKNYFIDLQSYIHDLVAYLSLRLAFDRNIINFNIATDDKKWQSFGDIVFEVLVNKGNKEKKTVYAIKCKQISKNSKQIESLSDAKVVLAREYASIRALKNVANFEDTTFSIFTTCVAVSKFCTTEAVQADVFNQWKTGNDAITSGANLLVKPLTKKIELLNVTNEPENVFSIYPEKGAKQETEKGTKQETGKETKKETEKKTIQETEETEKYALPNIFVYTSQKVSSRMVRDILKSVFEKQEKFDRETQEYRKYIKQWSEGKLGGHYYLNRNDVILKIGEIFLTSYMSVPSRTLRTVNSKHHDFRIWNKVIENVDLIIIKSEPSIMDNICEPFNELIETTIGRIDDISNSVTITDDVVKKISDDPITRAYLFEEIDPSKKKLELNISKLYKVFWKSGKIPLPLSTEKCDSDFLLEIMATMKSYGVKKKFILMTADPFFENTAQCGLRVFSRLEDVKDLVDLTEIGLKLEGSTPEYLLTLDTISKTDSLFLKWITPNIFFEMALGKYHFKGDNSTRERTISDMKIILADGTIQEVQNRLNHSITTATVIPKGIDRGRLRGIDPHLFNMNSDCFKTD